MTTGTAHEHDTECQWCRGYEEQAGWLQGKTLAGAEQALDARRATLEADPYNDGGNIATQDYIDHLRGEA